LQDPWLWLQSTCAELEHGGKIIVQRFYETSVNAGAYQGLFSPWHKAGKSLGSSHLRPVPVLYNSLLQQIRSIQIQVIFQEDNQEVFPLC